MKRKHYLLKEKSNTRDAVGQISSWCLLIALLVNYKNWRDAQISLSLFRHK